MNIQVMNEIIGTTKVESYEGDLFVQILGTLKH
jgi:hypothetical protein